MGVSLFLKVNSPSTLIWPSRALMISDNDKTLVFSSHLLLCVVNIKKRQSSNEKKMVGDENTSNS